MSSQDMLSNTDAALTRAEALFKRKEEQLREGGEAMAEYRARATAVREKTTRLRALRLARDEAVRRKEAVGKRKTDATTKRKIA